MNIANRHQTISVETYVRRSYNYLEKMVDVEGLPYFNIFWTEPPQAAHDWPDFGDVMSRQYQAAVMARIMTGKEVLTEKIWLEKILSLIDVNTGLLTRPETNFSKPVSDPGDNYLTLYALVTAYADKKDEVLHKTICTMIDHILDITNKGPETGGVLNGFGIKSVMMCLRCTGYQPALELAHRIVAETFEKGRVFTPDNTFRHGGHMHGNLRSLVGAADYALYTRDPVLFSRVDAIYRYVRSEATDFGFLPEAIGRQGDIISCETCAIMDYLGLAITLANHGHPEYWDDVEKIFRNHLVESQVKDGSWLQSNNSIPDTAQFTYNSIGDRMLGGYAGWTSPNHILAARETLNKHWGGPELRDKTRAFQNCCGGSGVHAFFEVWKNAARFQDGCLMINLHIDKLLTQAEIRGYQPYTGLLDIRLNLACEVKVRIPDFVQVDHINVEVDGEPYQFNAWGNYLELGKLHQDAMISIKYPLPIWSEIIKIQNPGFRAYQYRVTWKGSTVTRMEPLGNDYAEGYSDFDSKQVPVFYGEDGPGPLYLRDEFIKDFQPEQIGLAPLSMDQNLLDFWYLV